MQKIYISVVPLRILSGICPFMRMNNYFNYEIEQMSEEPDSTLLCSASCLQKSLTVRELQAHNSFFFSCYICFLIKNSKFAHELT